MLDYLYSCCTAQIDPTPFMGLLVCNSPNSNKQALPPCEHTSLARMTMHYPNGIGKHDSNIHNEKYF